MYLFTSKEIRVKDFGYHCFRALFYNIACFYVFSFSRVGICLLALHYTSEALFHAARLIYFLDKSENGSKGTGFKGF